MIKFVVIKFKDETNTQRKNRIFSPSYKTYIPQSKKGFKKKLKK
jgi:hypothetical protein